MKRITSMVALMLTLITLTGCCWWDTCCDSDPYNTEPCCGEIRPHCCPKPHIWAQDYSDPSNYELN
jgi:hypothetical protein